jgi:hypothetical protein
MCKEVVAIEADRALPLGSPYSRRHHGCLLVAVSTDKGTAQVLSRHRYSTSTGTILSPVTVRAYPRCYCPIICRLLDISQDRPLLPLSLIISLLPSHHPHHHPRFPLPTLPSGGSRRGHAHAYFPMTQGAISTEEYAICCFPFDSFAIPIQACSVVEGEMLRGQGSGASPGLFSNICICK